MNTIVADPVIFDYFDRNVKNGDNMSIVGEYNVNISTIPLSDVLHTTLDRYNNSSDQDTKRCLRRKLVTKHRGKQDLLSVTVTIQNRVDLHKQFMQTASSVVKKTLEEMLIQITVDGTSCDMFFEQCTSVVGKNKKNTVTLFIPKANVDAGRIQEKIQGEYSNEKLAFTKYFSKTRVSRIYEKLLR